MNGEILTVDEIGNGVILAEDGNRYSFLKEDTNNQILRAGQKVNFVQEGNTAKDIFLIKSKNSSFSSEDIMQTLNIDKSDTRKGAVYAAGGVIISFFTIIPFLGVIFAAAGLVLELIGVKKLSDNAKIEKDIFKNMLFAIILGLIGIFLMYIIIGASAVGSMATLSMDETGSLFGAGFGIGSVIGILIFIGFSIVSVLKMFKSLKSIANEYKVSLLGIAAWLYLAGIILMPLGIGFLILFAFNIVKIIGYLKIEK